MLRWLHYVMIKYKHDRMNKLSITNMRVLILLATTIYLQRILSLLYMMGAVSKQQQDFTFHLGIFSKYALYNGGMECVL